MGIDVNEKSIATAKEIQMQEGTKVDFRTYNGLDIPFQEETFDKVISCWVWQHILEPEDFQATVKEVCRVLKRCGKICFIEQVAKQKIIPKDFAEDYVIRRTPEEYIKEFERSGCRLVKCYPIITRGKGLFYKLICRNFIPQFFKPFIFLFVGFDLLLTRRMRILQKDSIDYLFLFKKLQVL
jgi:SAM-dependent methyltransferase